MPATFALRVWMRLRLLQTPREDGEGGQGMVEYALILMLIAIVVIVVVSLIGHQVNNVFSNVSRGLGT